MRQAADVKRAVTKSNANRQIAEDESNLPTQLQEKQNMPARITQNTTVAWTIKCDSIVNKKSSGERIEKTEYNYDGRGNLISETYYDWNTVSNKWIGRSKYEYAYDNNR